MQLPPKPSDRKSHKQPAQKSEAKSLTSIEQAEQQVNPAPAMLNIRRHPWILLLLLSAGLLPAIGMVYLRNNRQATNDNNERFGWGLIDPPLLPNVPTETVPIPSATHIMRESTGAVGLFAPKKPESKSRPQKLQSENIDSLIKEAIIVNSHYGTIGGKVLRTLSIDKATQLINKVLKKAIIASSASSALQSLTQHNEKLYISFHTASLTEPNYLRLFPGLGRAAFRSKLPPSSTLGFIALSAEYFSKKADLLELCASLTNELSHFRHAAIMRAIYHQDSSSPQKTNLPYVTEEEQEEMNQAVFHILSSLWESTQLPKLIDIGFFRTYMVRILVYNTPAINKLKNVLLNSENMSVEVQEYYRYILHHLSSKEKKAAQNKYASEDILNQEKDIISDIDSLHAILKEVGVLTGKQVENIFMPLNNYYARLADRYLKVSSIPEHKTNLNK